MPIAKTGKWGPGALARAPDFAMRAPSFGDLVASQGRIARSADEVSAALQENLALTREVAGTSTLLETVITPAIESQGKQVWHLHERVARIEEKIAASAPAQEFARLSDENVSLAEVLADLQTRMEALGARVEDMDNRLAGVETYCGALEREIEETESQLAHAKKR
jgi:predicted  nucleic acid-binding Zn-ribbon protein